MDSVSTRQLYCPSSVRAAMRNASFTLLHRFLIGLKSGLYGGRSISCAPVASIRVWTSGVLWAERLSITHEAKPPRTTRRTADLGASVLFVTADRWWRWNLQPTAP